MLNTTIQPGSFYGQWEVINITSSEIMDEKTICWRYHPTFKEKLYGKNGQLEVYIECVMLTNKSEWQSRSWIAAINWINTESASAIAQSSYRKPLATRLNALAPKQVEYVRNGKHQTLGLNEIAKVEVQFVKQSKTKLGAKPYFEITLKDNSFLKLNNDELAAAFPDIALPFRYDYACRFLNEIKSNKK